MKKQQVSFNGNTLTVEYPTIGKKFVVDCSKYPPEIYQPCAASQHGMKQKFGDAESAKSAVEKYAMVQRIHAGLLEGEWKLKSSGPQFEIIVEAICRLEKVGYAGRVGETGNFLFKKPGKKEPSEVTMEKLQEYGSNLKIKAEVAKIRAERAAAIADDSDDEPTITL